MKKLLFDTAERAGWTGAQAALAVLAVELADKPVWWAVPLGVALAAAKGWVASKVGRRGTASTLPASKDPAAPLGPAGV